jgi:hypothetical protein
MSIGVAFALPGGGGGAAIAKLPVNTITETRIVRNIRLFMIPSIYLTGQKVVRRQKEVACA